METPRDGTVGLELAVPGVEVSMLEASGIGRSPTATARVMSVKRGKIRSLSNLTENTLRGTERVLKGRKRKKRLLHVW